MKVDILAIGVHPDDVELSACGTLLAHAARGYSFGLLDLTRGELGTRGTADIRDAEAAEAARRMGAAFRRNLGMADGFLRNTEDNVRRIATALRQYRPDIVLANAPADRHPDHGRAARLTSEACFYSGLRKMVTHGADGTVQAPWRPRAVYHYIQDRNLKPDFVVDITDHFEGKMHCIAAYVSQFNDHEDNAYRGEDSTPISGSDFMAFLAAKARNFGREAGYTMAEGFTVDRYSGVRDLFDLD